MIVEPFIVHQHNTAARNGLEATTNSTVALDRYNEAVLAFAGHRAETGALLEAALAEDAGFVLGHCLRGFAACLLGRREHAAAALAALDAAWLGADERGITRRERLHLLALVRWVAGRMDEAAEHLGNAVLLAPGDLAAIKLEHALRFMLGDAAGMRRSLMHSTASWTADMQGYGYVQGCLAFALEETGDLEAAIERGRAACESEPGDAWGTHAVAHAFEMMGRPAEGLQWLRSRETHLAGVNNFRHHLWWHQALFCLELGKPGDALQVHDQRLQTIRTDDYRDLANAASLLARIEEEGIAVGDRWAALADLAQERADECGLAFAALHDLLALTSAGRDRCVAEMIATLRAGARRVGDTQAGVLTAVGLTLAEMLVARSRGDHDGAVELFLRAEPRLALIGGSHAQRDLFGRLAVASALAAGRHETVRLLLTRRNERYASSRWANLHSTALERLAHAETSSAA